MICKDTFTHHWPTAAGDTCRQCGVELHLDENASRSEVLSDVERSINVALLIFNTDADQPMRYALLKARRTVREAAGEGQT